MPTAIPRTRTSPENLSVHAEAVRAQTAALLASFHATRQWVAQTRLQGAELRDACREARLRCHLAAKRSAARRQPPVLRRSDSLQIAHAVARSLSELGVPAFVFEPSQDTAIHL
ncbi:MAG: hypothetical protein ACLPWF_14230 [Bryobacteraceae bacterium]|jgi:hypothetical protein